MSKEYFENSRSKITFILMGIVIVFALIAIFDTPSNNQNQMLQTYEDRYQQMQSDFEREKETFRDYQQSFLQQPQPPVPPQQPEQSVYSLEISLSSMQGKLVGFVSSSDLTTLARYKKALKKYAKITDSGNFSFSFESGNTDKFSDIYEILGH